MIVVNNSISIIPTCHLWPSLPGKKHYGKNLSSTYLVIRLLGAILHLPLDIMNPFKDLMPSDAHLKMLVVLNHH